MIHEIFYWVLNMSIAAALTALVVIVIRFIKRIPRRVAVFFWIAPFLRMCLPVGLDSPISLMGLVPNRAVEVVPDISVSMLNSVMAAESYFPVTYRTAPLELLFHWAGTVWLIGFGVIMLTIIVLYGLTLRELRGATHIRDNLYFSDKVKSPAIYGILHPKIILPQGDTADKLVLLHEQTHIRWGDNLWRMVAFFLTAIHWFDPLAWVSLRLFLTDLELACDERVLARVGADRAGEYAHCLLDRQAANVFVSAFGGAPVRARIGNILSFKKMTWISAVAALVLVAAILAVLLTNGG